MKKIKVNGVVVSNEYGWMYDYYEMEYTSPEKVINSLPTTNEDIEIEVNSPGGDVFAGSEIYTALKEYPGNVHVKIVGVGASIASVIAMAGNKVSISPTAQIMIHNVQSGMNGDYRDLQSRADALKSMNVSISNAYEIKTGLPQDKLLEMMNKETWLNAQEALSLGFVDEIMFQNTSNYVASTNGLGLPFEVINEMMNNKDKYQKKDVAESVSEQINSLSHEQLITNLKLIKLKGAIK